jgi:hypothetical protein
LRKQKHNTNNEEGLSYTLPFRGDENSENTIDGWNDCVKKYKFCIKKLTLKGFLDVEF